MLPFRRQKKRPEPQIALTTRTPSVAHDSVRPNWFRKLAISEIPADTLETMGLKLPASHRDIA